MKKVLFSLSALFALGFANAQDTATATEGFKAGDTFMSGTVSFDSQKSGDFKNTTFKFTPSVGYFVTENIALGVSLGYTNSDNDYTESGYNEKTNTLSADIFGRYYFNPGSKFTVFGQLDLGYSTSKRESYGFDSYDINGFGAAVAPGINYWVSSHLALEASFGILGYATAKPDYYDAESTDVFSIGLDLSNVNFGLIYKF